MIKIIIITEKGMELSIDRDKFKYIQILITIERNKYNYKNI